MSIQFIRRGIQKETINFNYCLKSPIKKFFLLKKLGLQLKETKHFYPTGYQ